MNTAGLGARTSFRFATERRNGLHFLQRALHGTAWHGMTCLQTLRAIGRHGLKLAARPEVQAGPCMGIPAIGMATFAIMCQGRWPRRHGHVWPRRALHRRRRMARRFVWQLAERSICCLPETKLIPTCFKASCKVHGHTSNNVFSMRLDGARRVTLCDWELCPTAPNDTKVSFVRKTESKTHRLTRTQMCETLASVGLHGQHN